jgi:hypothetical protein
MASQALGLMEASGNDRAASSTPETGIIQMAPMMW